MPNGARYTHGTHVKTAHDGVYELPKGSIGVVAAPKYDLPGYEVRFKNIPDLRLYCFADEIERV